MNVRRIIASLNYRLIGPATRRDARNWSAKTDFRRTHRRVVKVLEQSHAHDEAVRLAVGGEFDAIGILLREALIHHGLKSTDYLIDVGCGSGRLAKPISTFLTGKYLGIDVVPELVSYAQDLVSRSDWRFEAASGLSIPEEDQKADMVCFFSVLTHLLHEESFVYLREAKRVLRPGGKIVLSFLDFRMASHWPSFESSINDIGIGANPLNVFLCGEMLIEWAKRLDLEVETIMDGDLPYLPLGEPLIFDDGTIVRDRTTFGQSVCVMVRR